VFNLLMSGSGWEVNRDTFGSGRVLEHTEDALVARFKPGGVLDMSAVAELPTLFASETHHDGGQQSARVGTVTRVRLVGNNYQLEYVFDPDISPIPNSTLEAIAGELGIAEWEFSRTHWAIKDADLFRVLLKRGLGQRPKPKVFSLSDEPVDAALVAVMMPFDARFDPVYERLQEAVAAAGMICQRADDIWIHDHIIQDVVSLVCRASVVICDLSGRNANVFYEMGIAHVLAKDVIMIAQSAHDVPFDVAHIRHIRYLPNGEGLAQLVSEVRRRLEGLRERR
jgi:hypothetical protein